MRSIATNASSKLVVDNKKGAKKKKKRKKKEQKGIRVEGCVQATSLGFASRPKGVYIYICVLCVVCVVCGGWGFEERGYK